MILETWSDNNVSFVLILKNHDIYFNNCNGTFMGQRFKIQYFMENVEI